MVSFVYDCLSVGLSLLLKNICLEVIGVYLKENVYGFVYSTRNNCSDNCFYWWKLSDRKRNYIELKQKEN